MVNIPEFTIRLKKVMEIHQLSASMFADKIGVQRSSISHVLSGRNKPSLDFVLKVTEAFQDVDMYWLLNGKGNYPKKLNAQIKPTSTPSLFKNDSNNTTVAKKIQRIVVFYDDGTFDEYMK
ncbi:XRE family transcriptional regulator [Polaribacter sp. WD7]|uniref:helix-turn-helix domain-containing protein n=1 Tax=Polaribacter sp. WD7 TaxID=2269061 RepID=UPI000DF33868|nr:helix-turn-helix transcriptional regulator [Polaribacter sp. WD7]RCS26938.1 XRE family transcriptional regulator [Polaribacter sp. WD7]